MKLENVCLWFCQVSRNKWQNHPGLFFSHCALYLALRLCSVIHLRAMWCATSLRRKLSSPRASAGVSIIESGWWHTCALLTVGTVNCWGYNLYGQLGTGDTTNRLTPTAVVGLKSGEKGVIYFHYKITIFIPYVQFQTTSATDLRSISNCNIQSMMAKLKVYFIGKISIKFLNTPGMSTFAIYMYMI